MPTPLKVDYLIVGAGAMGMAFADVLVRESSSSVAIVDRYDAPGGHWNLSYPFVRLHGPSKIYGVNSRSMPSDSAPFTANLASGHEVLDYYDRVMHETLLGSGRVTYLPRHEVTESNSASATAHARSLVTGTTTEILVNRRIVDASYMNITVPAMQQRGYTVEPGVALIPVGELPAVGNAEHFTVVGAGKTGIDACLWLLNHGVDAGRIRWIVPRDAWLMNRAIEAQGGDFTGLLMLNDCETADQVLGTIEQMTVLLRRDPSASPEAFRCATVTADELGQLRSIEDVVRLGRVRRIDTSSAELEHGSVAASPSTLYVDCTADGLTKRKPLKPLFEPGFITLQPLLPCLQPISAAIAAKLESSDLDDGERNALSEPVHNPDSAMDVLRFFAIRFDRMIRWSVSPQLADWLAESRLGAGLAGIEKASDPDFQREGARLVAHLHALADSAF